MWFEASLGCVQCTSAIAEATATLLELYFTKIHISTYFLAHSLVLKRTLAVWELVLTFNTFPPQLSEILSSLFLMRGAWILGGRPDTSTTRGKLTFYTARGK